MKYGNKIFIILTFFGFFFEILSISPIEMDLKESHLSIRHLLVHFPASNIDQNEATQLLIEQDLLNEINHRLIAGGYLIPFQDEHAQFSCYSELIKRSLKKIYYSLFYYKYCSEYPDRLNYAFFERKDPVFGFYTLYIPDGVPYSAFSSIVQSVYKENKFECYVDEDIGVYLTAQEKAQTEKDYFTLAQLKEKDKNILWHQSFPSTGLILQEPYYPPAYPYIPHFFSLHQLAPKQGAGITIALIDTGACAFQVQGQTHYYKHRDLNLKYEQLGVENLTITGNNRNSSIAQLAATVQSHLKQKISLDVFEKITASWACLNDELKKYEKIEQFLSSYGNEMIFDASRGLTAQGKKLADKILKGLSSYRVGWLTEPYNKYAILNFLPTSCLHDPARLLSATHGTHTLSLISARAPENDHDIIGLAPQANVMMIKAFNDKGISSKLILIDAVKKAISGNVDVLNLSLKIADRMDLSHESSKTLGQLIGLLPYVVAASGNDGAHSRRPTLSYPSRFETVAFDVGAFGLENSAPTIPLFSQYEPNRGPLFVAPGVNILGAGIIPGLTDPSVYMYRSGTSMAAALMSGFLALLLGEFKSDFSKQEILNVCYHSTYKLAPTDDWKTKTILGVLDMRTALFVLHCIKKLKPEYPFCRFDQLMGAVFTQIEKPMHSYSTRYLNGINFKENFIAFVNQKKQTDYEYNKPNSVDDAIELTIKPVRELLTMKTEGIQEHTIAALPDRAQKKLVQQNLNNNISTRVEHMHRRLLAAREFSDNLV